MITAAAHAWRADPDTHDVLLDLLAEATNDGAPVAEVAMRLLDGTLDTLWQHGWTPTDLVQTASRRLTRAHADLVGAAAVADGRRRARSGTPPHDRWRAQLDQLSPRHGAPDGLERSPEHVRLLVAALSLLRRLPEIPPVMPGPAQDPAAGNLSTSGLDHRMLARVRALLAKAESTGFDEEAEALTAKAQELITRHAIADALTHTPDDTGAPSIRRVPVDSPYADAKAALLAVVAGANRCDAVHSADLGWVTLFGYDGDLDAVELLGASLLTQATNAIARQGSRRGRDGRSTTRSFRRSFLLGFAARIGERLRATTDTEMATTGATDPHLLPVLAVRDERVHAAVMAAYPDAERRATRGSNATGWSQGRAAADLAELGATSTPPRVTGR